MPKTDARVRAVTRGVVYQRDGYRCLACGTHAGTLGWSVHHRSNRGMGGSALRDGVQWLALLCGSGTTGCHGQITAGRLPRGMLTTDAALVCPIPSDPLTQSTGWVIPKLLDVQAETVPLFTRRGWILLTPDGGWTPTTPPEGHTP